jgi:hypothetical protein
MSSFSVNACNDRIRLRSLRHARAKSILESLHASCHLELLISFYFSSVSIRRDLIFFLRNVQVVVQFNGFKVYGFNE